MDVIKTQQIAARPIDKVVVHPLVLLSIVDNYNRVAKDTRKRVVGVLLGTSFKGTVDVTNSYAGFSSGLSPFLFQWHFRTTRCHAIRLRSVVDLEILHAMSGFH